MLPHVALLNVRRFGSGVGHCFELCLIKLRDPLLLGGRLLTYWAGGPVGEESFPALVLSQPSLQLPVQLLVLLPVLMPVQLMVLRSPSSLELLLQLSYHPRHTMTVP